MTDTTDFLGVLVATDLADAWQAKRALDVVWATAKQGSSILALSSRVVNNTVEISMKIEGRKMDQTVAWLAEKVNEELEIPGAVIGTMY